MRHKSSESSAEFAGDLPYFQHCLFTNTQYLQQEGNEMSVNVVYWIALKAGRNGVSGPRIASGHFAAESE